MHTPTETQPALTLWQRPFDGLTLTLAAMMSGALLWHAMFPGFYYMNNVFFVIMFWGVLAAWLGVRLFIAGLSSRATGRPVATTGWRGVTALVAVVTVLIAFKLPLHAAFAFAQADLEAALKQDQEPGESFPLARYRYGLYGIRQRANRRCHRGDRIYFTLASDNEAAFVYSPSGIDDLCYNSGNKGHLSGNWYWMKED